MIPEPFTAGFLRRLQQLKIHTRRSFLGSRQGIHRSLRRGHGLEFSDYRVYTPGDDFRHIDWSAYGRTDRLYVREFQEEQDLNVIVLLDTSASMALPENGNKFELARNLALALGYIGLTDGDTVTFSLLGKKNTAKFVGTRAITRATAELHDINPEGKFNFVNEVRAAVAYQRLPGKCFFLSDFLFDSEDQFSALDVLRAKNFDISLIQVLAPSELRLDLELGNYVIDVETNEIVELGLSQASVQEYAKTLAAHIAQLEAYCFKAGIAHILVSSAHSVSDIVLNELPARGLLK